MLEEKSFVNIYMLAYDGEESDGGEGGDSGGDGGGESGGNSESGGGEANKNNDSKNKGKTFTQEELNRILADDRRKTQKNRDDLVKQMNTWKENLTLTEQQKEELQTRIDQIQAETLTQQELSKKERDKLTKEWEKREKTLSSEKDYWKNLYTVEKIQREITDAAIEHKAISPIQITDQVTPKSKLVEVFKDGKPTGIWETRVTLRDKNENGEVIMLELPVTEAVKRMKDMPEHWNLFDSGLNGGLGSFNNNNTSGTLRGTRPPQDHSKYQKWREQNIKG